MEIGAEMVRGEKQRAEQYWEMRTADPEAIEPPPAVLRKMVRSKR